MTFENDCIMNEIVNEMPLSEKLMLLEVYSENITLHYGKEGLINKETIKKMKSLIEYLETIDLE